MHIYLCLVNKSGDPSVEQVPEEGFHSVEVGTEGCVTSEISDNPDTVGKPRSIQPLPCVFTNIIHLSLMFGALSALIFLYHSLIPFLV